MMINMVPSSVYLYMRLRGGTRALPFYYAASNELTIIVTLSCILLLMNSRQIVPSTVLLIEPTNFSMACVLKMFNMLFPRHEQLISAATGFVIVGNVCLAIHIALWIKSLRRRFLKGAFEMDNVELACFIYL
jgi:hypothetical protein